MYRATRIQFLLFVVLTATVGPAHGAGIVWKGDYASARQESFEKNRPIVLVFGGENCMWCRKLEATTLRDPGVISALGDRFVCLKVDGDREVALTQALRVQTYPTVVIAAPDGKILATIDGYHEPNKLLDQLNRAAPPQLTPTPDWMVRDFQEAARAVVIADYSRAIGLLREVVKDGGDRNIQVKARTVLGDLEQQASVQLGLAKTLHQRGRSQEAVDVLTDLLRSYAGTQASSDSGVLLASLSAKPEVREGLRVRKARELLAQAKDDFQSQQFLGCLERCELLLASFSDLAESAEAKKLAVAVQDNPEYLAKACDALNHRSGAMYLALADSWMKKGQPEQAAVCLERVLQVAPGSRPAEVAQAKLGQLGQQRTSAYPGMDRK
ncbi:MAG: thioredoxin family protein [Gemmataceae bacterium]|nr:thioredoxin family protein [Gemmataceae bacterium]